jgi:hypothetical protein
MGNASPGSRSGRCVDAAGPRAGPEAGTAQWGRARHGPLGPALLPLAAGVRKAAEIPGEGHSIDEGGSAVTLRKHRTGRSHEPD